jgi:hypothetical protein
VEMFSTQVEMSYTRVEMFSPTRVEMSYTRVEMFSTWVEKEEKIKKKNEHFFAFVEMSRVIDPKLIKGDISEIVFYQVYLGHKRRQT